MSSQGGREGKSKKVRRERSLLTLIYIYILGNPPAIFLLSSHLLGPLHPPPLTSPCSFLFSLPSSVFIPRSRSAPPCVPLLLSLGSFLPVHLRKGGKGGVSARAKSGVCAFLRVNAPPDDAYVRSFSFYSSLPLFSVENSLSS